MNICPAVGQHPNACPSRAQHRPSPRTDPGSIVPRSAKPESHARSCARLYRANRKATPRGRAAQLTYRGRSRRPTRKALSTSGQILRPKSSVGRTRRTNAKTLGHDRPDRADSHDSTTGRTSRPNVRTVGRPEAVSEARFTRFKPNTGTDLLDLGLAAFLYLEHYKYFFLAL
ncbi:unnamed protein product [Microthlaspi erraticum]|uniref:Uncharacterized protein n=1 Tax=Microthlaspi erraticum TaxID=1685480 RepID=A0A6D2IU11_9BRAS|nr:unnamed protein product [Microthlaspi erraticum]